MTSVGVVRSTVTVTVDIGACGVRHGAALTVVGPGHLVGPVQGHPLQDSDIMSMEVISSVSKTLSKQLSLSDCYSIHGTWSDQKDVASEQVCAAEW